MKTKIITIVALGLFSSALIKAEEEVIEAVALTEPTQTQEPVAQEAKALPLAPATQNTAEQQPLELKEPVDAAAPALDLKALSTKALEFANTASTKSTEYQQQASSLWQQARDLYYKFLEFLNLNSPARPAK